MPRLKERVVRFAGIQMLFKSYGLNGNRIHEAIGSSAPTAKRKMDNPELFTVGDLDAINRHFGVPWDDIREAMKR